MEDAGFGALGALVDPSPVAIADGRLDRVFRTSASACASPERTPHDHRLTTTNDLETPSSRRAAAAAPIWARSSAADRATWLRAAADALDAAADELVPIADRETRLGETRLRGEVGRTSGQLRLFATVVEEGSYLELTVDDADAVGDAAPPRAAPHCSCRVGPVAVFSASNFPFAFSVAGGDTASALAAGSPVIVKAHSGHPELSRRTAAIVADALEAAGAPAGSLALVEGREAGNALVQHPVIQAAGFTGSLVGGRALFDLATGRPDPIPFYGELGSVNPVVITPAAVARPRRGARAGTRRLVHARRRAVLHQARRRLRARRRRVRRRSSRRSCRARPAGRCSPTASPTPSRSGIDAPGRRPVGRGRRAGHRARSDGAQPIVLTTDAAAVAARPETLLEECFGPGHAARAVLVRGGAARARCDAVPGSLTATLHSEPGDDVDEMLALLQRKAGRVLFAGWPTGVAVTWSQQHGGPWPATTSLHTSVGATAIRRFLRPVAFQAAPAAPAARGAARRGARDAAAPPQRRARSALTPCPIPRALLTLASAPDCSIAVATVSSGRGKEGPR